MGNAELNALMGAGSVGLVLALVQVLVKPFIPDTRLYPVFSLIFGLGLNLFIGLYLGMPVVASLLQGLMAGLAASGAYSLSSTFREGSAANRNHPEHGG